MSVYSNKIKKLYQAVLGLPSGKGDASRISQDKNIYFHYYPPTSIEIDNVSLNRNKNFLAVNFNSKTIKIYNYLTGLCHQRITFYEAERIDFSNNGNYILIQKFHLGPIFHVYDIENESNLLYSYDLLIPKDPVFIPVCFGKDEDSLLFFTHCLQEIFFITKNRRDLLNITFRPLKITSSSDSHFIAIETVDCSLLIYDYSLNKIVFTKKLQDRIQDMCFSPDNKSIVVGIYSNDVLIIKLENFDVSILNLPNVLNRGGIIRNFSYSGDSKYLVVTCTDLHVLVFDLISKKCIVSIKHYRVIKYAFLNDNNQILYLIDDKKINYYSLKTKKEILHFYFLDKGFLWSVPKDLKTKSPMYFWTNRNDLIQVVKCNDDFTGQEVLREYDGERKAYIIANNRKDIILEILCKAHKINITDTSI